MMSNTSNGPASRGSKFWTQEVVNSKLPNVLNVILKADIKWLSPLKEQNYAEYKLRQKYICDIIGITKDNYSFWPTGQPQWDAIGISQGQGEKTLFLVEAKAHLSEWGSYPNARSKNSKRKIKISMKQVFNKKYSSGKFKKWHKGYYQLGNRLTFLEKLNELSSETGLKVKLVLLNFVNDYTYKPTTAEEWTSHYKGVFNEMTGSENPPVDVIVINVDCPVTSFVYHFHRHRRTGVRCGICQLTDYRRMRRKTLRRIIPILSS